LTAVIATSGVVAAVIFNNQLSVMQGQLDEMRQSFVADRAYVLNGGFKGYGKASVVSGIESAFVFKNFGRTPAEIRMISGQCIYSAKGYPTISSTSVIPGITDASGRIPSGAIPLEAGKEIGPFAYKLDATSDQIEQARIGNGKIYCRSVIAYDDMRKNAHETSVCFVFNFGANAFLACTEEGANYHD
jgi:hypothetical protein